MVLLRFNSYQKSERKIVAVSFFNTPFIFANIAMTRNQINDTFLFQNRVKVKVVGEVSEK